jgi:hypothetical protein
MPVNGHIFEVTDLQAFLFAVLLGQQPAPATFRPLASAHVALSGRLAVGERPLGGADSGADGAFSFAIASPALVSRLRIVASLPEAGAPRPVYRSEFATVAAVVSDPLELFVAEPPQSLQIAQADIQAKVGAAKAQLGLDTLSAAIRPDGVRVHGTRGPVKVEFLVRLAPDTSSNLDSFVRGTVDEFEVDKPALLCIRKERIEEMVRDAVSALFVDLNAQAKDTLIGEVAEQTGLPESVVGDFIDAHLSVTVRRLSFPVVSDVPGPGGTHLVQRAIQADLAIGLPRDLVGGALGVRAASAVSA